MREVQLLPSHGREVATVIVCETFHDPVSQLTQTNAAQCTVAAPVTSFPGTSSSASYLDGCQHSCRFRRVAFLMLPCTWTPVPNRTSTEMR